MPIDLLPLLGFFEGGKRFNLLAVFNVCKEQASHNGSFFTMVNALTIDFVLYKKGFIAL